jgi:probable HAF family extracellular repeat protein
LHGNGQMTGLGTVGGGNFSYPNAINASGWVARTPGTSNAGCDAFLWNGQKMTGLGQQAPAGGYNSSLSSPCTHAVLWQNGTVTDLGTLGGLKSTPAVINNNGQIAGPEDNEMVVRDGLLDGHKQPGRNLNLSVAASPAGTQLRPGDVPSTSPPTTKPSRSSRAAGPINC